MEKHYDFVAIGGGSAGFNAARLATQFAAKVAVIEGARELGGLCILRGCMPSKTLIYAAEVLHHARLGAKFGLNIPTAAADMPAVRARKRRIIGEFADYRAQQLAAGKFDLIRSFARFSGPNELTLDDGAVLTADRILVGVGSRVSWPAIPGLRETGPWTSDDVLDLDFVPESVIVLGGGVVACELAQYLARIGARVIQVQRSPRVLKEHDTDATAVVERALCADGIELFTGTSLQRVTLANGEFCVVFEHGGKKVERRARHCLNALGREPDLERLNLSAAGVACDEEGRIRTNEFQQTANPRVYAAGDCTGPHEIVHVAIQQAEVAVRHAFGRETAPVNYDLLLQVAFTDPQLATAGLTRPELVRRGIPFLSATYPFDDHGKSILMEARLGHVRVFAAPKTGKILGAEIVGPDAGELIHIFSVAMNCGLDVREMLRAPWYHPTLAEIITYPLEEIADQLSAS